MRRYKTQYGRRMAGKVLRARDKSLRALRKKMCKGVRSGRGKMVMYGIVDDIRLRHFNRYLERVYGELHGIPRPRMDRYQMIGITGLLKRMGF